MRLVSFLVSITIFTLIATGVTVAAAKRVKTGVWSLPDAEDVRWMLQEIRPVETPRVIYLSRAEIEVIGGYDDSARNRTSMVAYRERRAVPGFRGSERAWRAITTCVADRFAAYDVVVTDRRPAERGYVTVQIGGHARDLGLSKRNLGGIAPYSGQVVGDPMVFVFSEHLRRDVRRVCETVAHEVGHVYGLDHSYRCSDLMSYLSGCGRKRFVDQPVPCGEGHPRACTGGQPGQNSHSWLVGVLGPARAEPALVASRSHQQL